MELRIPLTGGCERYGGRAMFCPILRYVVSGARKLYPSLTLVLTNALDSVRLFCSSKNGPGMHDRAWEWEGETVILKQIAPPGFSVLHQSWNIGWWVDDTYLRVILYQATSCTKNHWH